MKTIKTPEQHAEALARFDLLASRDDLTETQQDQLEVLAVLIEKYEQETHPVANPTPLEAIRFRMEQMGYTQKDLGRVLGAQSRASEVLAGKRGLSPAMMRALRDAWGIPADSLLGGGGDDPDPSAPQPSAVGGRDPKNYPMKQMYDRGYFPGRSGEWRKHKKDLAGLLERLFKPDAGLEPAMACNRQGSGKKTTLNPLALEAWRWRVLARAADEKPSLPRWDPEALDDSFLQWLASLSSLADGPRLACEALEEKGLPVIIEARLEQTRLDGAALATRDGRPVIGLTLRYNRLDNFWFTLFHEIGHVRHHLKPDNPALFDSDIDEKKTTRIEQEADRFALDTLIPPDAWNEVRQLHYAADIRAAAKRLRLSPAILAGRLRREAGDYRKHRTLIGQGKARAAFGFTEQDWPK
ncbi:MAG: ImmA/IrrE family metallo-endopeptidase [Verrucomicrobiota bacterium JB025]|nr:ImmA/IrrE family metallo-endopeptidase [Verrucomicrobiota bacterium JB025]